MSGSLRETSKTAIVLDVLETKSADVARENQELKSEIERLKHEMENESLLFNMKVVELQNKFYQVEEQIRLKNNEIERFGRMERRLRGGGTGGSGGSDCDRSVVTETEILEDTLRSGVNVDSSGIYTSLDVKYPQSPVPFSSQVIDCLRQFLIIVVCVSIIILITIVIPLKIALTS